MEPDDMLESDAGPEQTEHYRATRRQRVAVWVVTGALLAVNFLLRALLAA